jgi:hypothetical protein
MSLLDRNLPYLTCAQFGLEKIGKGIFFLFPVGIIWKMVTPFHSLSCWLLGNRRGEGGRRQCSIVSLLSRFSISVS